MKKPRYSDSQTTAILKQGEAGTPVPGCAGSMGTSMMLCGPR